MIRFLNPQDWAARTFARVELGDKRRTRRAVSVAAKMISNPRASLPEQMRQRKHLVAAYRLLSETEVTHDALMYPHYRLTLSAALHQPVVLLVQDTTELDYSRYAHYHTDPSISGLGPIGNGTGRGMFVQTVLAVVPSPRQVLGIAHQEPFVRHPLSEEQKHQRSYQRQNRARESQVWARAVKAIGYGPAPISPSRLWVHVGDRGADLYEFLAAARQYECHFLVRAVQDRCIADAQGQRQHLMNFARTLPCVDEREIELSGAHGQPSRRVKLALGVSTEPVRVLPPVHPRQANHDKAPLEGWVVRVWEQDPPAHVKEGVEWVLLSSVPTPDLSEGWERVEWYKCRWLVEDFHQCLKSGCGIEQRQLRTGQGLKRLLGLCTPIAVRLLQLREIARMEPDRLAVEELPVELVEVVGALAEMEPEEIERLTVGRFWKEVARLGGHQGRRRDGPPGWKTLWRGWTYVQTVMQGVRLTPRLHSPP
jgi:hypothetical protein